MPSAVERSEIGKTPSASLGCGFVFLGPREDTVGYLDFKRGVGPPENGRDRENFCTGFPRRGGEGSPAVLFLRGTGVQ